MEVEPVERVGQDLGDRLGGEAAAVPRTVDPVADAAALQAAADDPERLIVPAIASSSTIAKGCV
jgi:hypothetical protein